MLQEKISYDAEQFEFNAKLSNAEGLPVEKVLIKLALDDIKDLSQNLKAFLNLIL